MDWRRRQRPGSLDPATETFAHYRHTPDNPNSFSSDNIQTILQDEAGILWVGTSTEGLNCFDPVNGSVTRYRHDPLDGTSLSENWAYAFHSDGVQ